MTTAIDPSRIATIFGTKVIFKNLAPGGFAFPQRVAVIAMGSTLTTFSLTKKQISSAQEAGTTYGFGSQIHEIAEHLFPASGNGVGAIPVTIYPLADGTTASAGVITPTGTMTSAATYFATVGGIKTASFELASGATVGDAVTALETAVNGNLRIPVIGLDVTSTSVSLTCKWKGLSGDQITISVTGPAAGITFGITAMTSGAGDPAIDAALTNQFGNVWETMVIQGIGGVTATLDELSAFNEGRWAATVGRPIQGCYYTSVETSATTLIVIPDGRKTDRTNVQLSIPGADHSPWGLTAA